VGKIIPDLEAVLIWFLLMPRKVSYDHILKLLKKMPFSEVLYFIDNVLWSGKVVEPFNPKRTRLQKF